MSTASKLTYLKGTKQAIKQAINEDFEVIDDNTTFREYADEISSNNAKYKDLIPKETKSTTNTLDISNSSGLDKALVTQYGNTYQETTTGKNKLSPNLKPNGDRGITGTYNNSTGEITITGTPTAVFSNIGDRVDFATPLPAGTYTLSTEKVENVRIGLHLYKSGGDINNYAIALGNKELQITVTDEITGYYLYIYGLDSTKQYNQSFKAMFESGSSATDWEKYTGGNSAPNPDYPQEIVNISGKSTLKDVGKNLFDKDNVLTLPAYIGGTSGTITSSDGDKCLYIPCKPNTQYTISKISSLRFRAGFTDDIPVLTSVCSPYSGNTDAETSITLSSSTNSNYLIVFYWTLSDTLTEQQILDSIQIEENSTASPYEPYQEQSFDLDLKSKNLFDKSKANLNKGVNTSNGNLYNSTAQFATDYIPISVGSYITNGYSSSLNIVYGAVYDSTKTFLESVTTNTNIKTFTITNTNAAYIRLAGLLTEIDTYQLRSGTEEPTEYEPFYDINLCKIDTYKDRIYPLNGKWYLEKKIGKVVFDGSESWTLPQTNTNTLRFNCEQGLIDGLDTGTMKIISNKFVNGKATSDNNDYEHIRSAVKGFPNMIAICINKSRLSSQNIDGFKTWLSNNNVTVYYIATPTTEEITENNYPTLYSQLNNIKLFEGVNHLTFTNESGLDVEFDIEYYKDWKLD